MAAFPTCLEASNIPATATLTRILEIPIGMAFATLQVTALNDGNVNATIKVAISPSSTANGVVRANYIETRDEVVPGGVYSRFGVVVKGGNFIYVQASSPDVIFRVVALAHEQAV